MTMPEEILEFFRGVRMPLEHFPQRDGQRECWQFDGTDASGVGPVVQLFLSVNGHGRPSTFGDVDLTDLGGDVISATFALDTWGEDGVPWIRRHLVKVGWLDG